MNPPVTQAVKERKDREGIERTTTTSKLIFLFMGKGVRKERQQGRCNAVPVMHADAGSRQALLARARDGNEEDDETAKAIPYGKKADKTCELASSASCLVFLHAIIRALSHSLFFFFSSLHQLTDTNDESMWYGHEVVPCDRRHTHTAILSTLFLFPNEPACNHSQAHH